MKIISKISQRKTNASENELETGLLIYRIFLRPQLLIKNKNISEVKKLFLNLTLFNFRSKLKNSKQFLREDIFILKKMRKNFAVFTSITSK